MPRIRREAARLVHKGWSARKVGRYLGFHHTAVMEWVRRSVIIGDHPIPTKSCRPKSHPKQLKEKIIGKIVKKRLYVFVLIDVYSRWVYAKAYERMSGRHTIRFVNEAQRKASFKFEMLQSDHGPEFSQWFRSRIQKNHRFTRIGKPNDNAHIERVNRTIQEECLDKFPNDVKKINCELKKYLQYYNYERVHGGINYLTPMQVV